MQKINRVYLYLLFMELLIAFDKDAAASNMAAHLASSMERDDAAVLRQHMKDDKGNDEINNTHKKIDNEKQHDNDKISGFWRSEHYDMMTISTPAISADWIENSEIVKAGGYDGFVFLSKHSAESKILSLTCHSTGNFEKAKFGGNDSEVAIPHPHFQKACLKNLYAKKDTQFTEFDITIEATHHGPSALCKPTIFVEIGTTTKQWNDNTLCSMVANIVHETLISNIPQNNPVAICFGGTHYPVKFTDEILQGKYALGTVIPKRAISNIDEKFFEHIIKRNHMATDALLEWGGIQGSDKKRLEEMLSTTNLRVSHI